MALTAVKRLHHEELVVITKTYDLILWSCHHTGRFPRNHRFVLGERLERNLYDLLETLIQAKYSRQRQGLLEKGSFFVSSHRLLARENAVRFRRRLRRMQADYAAWRV